MGFKAHAQSSEVSESVPRNEAVQHEVVLIFYSTFPNSLYSAKDVVIHLFIKCPLQVFVGASVLLK